MMCCAICGSRGYDGAFDANGDFICVDCWATGEAIGRTAVSFCPAVTSYHVHYPAKIGQDFVDACNRSSRVK